jgi:flagellar basal body rod protein FlgC
MDAIGIARTGLQSIMSSLTASASNTANAKYTGPMPATSFGSEAAAAQGKVAVPNVDVTGALLDLLGVRQDFLANLSVIETVSNLEQRTIELWG